MADATTEQRPWHLLPINKGHRVRLCFVGLVRVTAAPGKQPPARMRRVPVIGNPDKVSTTLSLPAAQHGQPVGWADFIKPSINVTSPLAKATRKKLRLHPTSSPPTSLNKVCAVR